MVAKGWSRKYINAQVSRIRRMFAYAVEESLVPGAVHHALQVVKGLRKGAPGVRETGKVRPVPVDHIKAVLTRAHTVLKAMIRLAYHSGARPGEVCALKPCHLDRARKVWVYHVPPDANKTDHHEQERTVYLGPRAQKVLRPWLKEVGPDECDFSPARAERLRQAVRRAGRKTLLYPSHVRRLEANRKAAPKRAKRDHYDPISFRRAVKRLCAKATAPTWTPNRLRHNAATRFRKEYGIETARTLLGHRKLNTTEIYAEADRTKAQEAVRQIG